MTAPALGTIGPVVVMGVAGSGKSTVGAVLASKLHRPFIDADDLHPEVNITKMRAGRPLTDEDRQPWLHLVGLRLAADDAPVVACSALRHAYRDVLRSAAPSTRFVHLDPPSEVAGERLDRRVGHFAGRALLPAQFADLEPLDSDEPGCRLSTDGGIEGTVRSALDWLAQTDASCPPRAQHQIEVGDGRGRVDAPPTDRRDDSRT